MTDIVAYCDADVTDVPSFVACLDCSDGYDTTAYRAVSQSEANEYGDTCSTCGKDIFNDSAE